MVAKKIGSILQPRHADARNLLVRLLARCNDVGLFAKFDPLSMLGIFRQAYSHIGLINSALGLSRDVGPVEQRAQSPQCANSHTKTRSRIYPVPILRCS